MALTSLTALTFLAIAGGEGAWEPKNKPQASAEVPKSEPADGPKFAKRGGRRKPIISMQHIYGTVGLMRDASDAIWDLKFRDLHARHVDPLTAQFGSGVDVLVFVAERVGVGEAKVREHVGRASDAIARAKASRAVESAALAVALEKCRVMAEERSAAMARHFAMVWDILLPAYGGMIPGTVSDVTVILIYFFIVLYVSLRVFFKLFCAALRMASCILCYPCRCCCSRKREASTNDTMSGKVDHKEQPAAKAKTSSKQK